jgi:hypothetical protein
VWRRPCHKAAKRARHFALRQRPLTPTTIVPRQTRRCLAAAKAAREPEEYADDNDEADDDNDRNSDVGDGGDNATAEATLYASRRTGCRPL